MRRLPIVAYSKISGCQCTRLKTFKLQRQKKTIFQAIPGARTEGIGKEDLKAAQEQRGVGQKARKEAKALLAAGDLVDASDGAKPSLQRRQPDLLVP